MQVKLTARTSQGAWVGRIESVFPAGCSGRRRASFLDACHAIGLPPGHRLVGVLAADLRFIRPEDVWLRVLAGGSSPSNEVDQRLDSALAAVRVIDAYVCRRNADPELIEKLIEVPAAVLGRSENAISEWRRFHQHRLAGREVYGDKGPTRWLGFASFTPFAVATAVCASEYHTAQPVVSVAREFARLEWLSRELFAWVRGDKRRKFGFAVQWLHIPPVKSEFDAVLSEVNTIAEGVVAQWLDAKTFIDPAWAALLDEQLWNSIRFAGIAASAAEMKTK